VRGIADSKDLVLMQGLVHGRRSVRGHPKERSKLSVIEHQNFLFDMERICPYVAEMCNKFITLLDPEGCSVTQEWVDEGELARERTKNWRWRRPYDVRHGAADRGGIVRGNATQSIMSREGQDYAKRRVFVCASELVLDESLSHPHMGAIYHRGRSPSASTSESHGGGRDHVNDQELLGGPLR
ncbi:hypothetical protein GW17_00052834, partial [Ensete ventricosum]